MEPQPGKLAYQLWNDKFFFSFSKELLDNIKTEVAGGLLSSHFPLPSLGLANWDGSTQESSW
jgi:hypothetical protein